MTGYLFRRNQWKNKTMTNKKALFLDMDGTTLDDCHQMSKENIEALEKTVEAGHEVVITTGRPLASAKTLLKTYGLDKIGCRYVIAFNGGMMLDCKTGEILFSQTIPLPWLRELVWKAREADVYLQTYEGDAVLTERDDENLAHYVGKTGMPVKLVKDLAEEAWEEPCKALLINIHDQKRMLEFRSRMEGWAKDKVDMYFSCAEYMEIVPKGICKGNALRAFCERQGISIQNAVSAGDENNDLSMIQAAGTGCAVANALDHVKAEADYVTERDNNHSAIAEIVERFILQD